MYTSLISLLSSSCPDQFVYTEKKNGFSLGGRREGGGNVGAALLLGPLVAEVAFGWQELALRVREKGLQEVEDGAQEGGDRVSASRLVTFCLVSRGKMLQ